MKMSKELKNIKNDLMINFNLKDIYEPPSDEYIKEKWSEIMSWLKTMLEKGNSDRCYQEIYMQIDDLLINDIPPEVIKSIETILSEYSLKIKTTLDELQKKKGETFFKEFNHLWNNIIRIFNLLRKIMNKYEKLAYGNIQKNNVYEIFLYHLKLVLIESKSEDKELKENSFIKHSIDEVLNQISLLREEIILKLDNKEKKENNINEINMDIEDDNNNKKSKYYEISNEYLEKISLIIRFYCETGIYKEYFNKYFIKHTEDYYKKKTGEYIENNNIDKYINYVEEILSFENYLIVSYLNEITLKSVINKLNIILLSDKKNVIFTKYYNAKGAGENNDNYLNLNKNYELMKKIFILFKNIKLEEEIRKKFSDYIKKSCKEIYTKYYKNYKLFYENIDLLKKNIDHYITDSFLNDEKFKSTSKESLTKGMNQRPGFICDTFSKYIDNVLREFDDKKNLNEIKNIINDYMILFKYIENKDLYENFFIKKLCIRCLFNLNKSEEAQNYLIEQLKNECGPYFVSKSQEMISDIKASQEMTPLFNKENNKDKNGLYLPINYFVLSNYTWPIDKLVKGEIPDFRIGDYQKKFFEFYHKKNSGKSLFWHLPYCFGEVEMEIPKSKTPVKIFGNGVHFAILKCFTKSKTSLTIKDILNKTKIEIDIIQKYLKKLVNKNLLKYENDIYSINYEVNKDGNNEIALIDYDEEENEKNEEENEEKSIEERKFVIDAYVMKVLKQKKVMKRNDLISVVKEKMPFEERDEIINKRIDQLINNRYISIDDKDETMLKYC